MAIDPAMALDEAQKIVDTCGQRRGQALSDQARAANALEEIVDDMTLVRAYLKVIAAMATVEVNRKK
jgi:hypothetical protein